VPAYERLSRLVTASDDADDTGQGPVLAGDLIGHSLDCNHDEPPPSDNSTAGPDHTRGGAHGQCRHL
jgi:hypothetical protein